MLKLRVIKVENQKIESKVFNVANKTVVGVEENELIGRFKLVNYRYHPKTNSIRKI